MDRAAGGLGRPFEACLFGMACAKIKRLPRLVPYNSSMLRLLVYLWALPTTCMGLPFLLLAALGRGRVRLVTGVLEAHGPLIAVLLARVPITGGASAMTLGHIVIARDADSLRHTRTHERIHVRQVERWGPLFIPAYLLASLLAALRGRDPYLDNPFERQAYTLTENRLAHPLV